MSDEQISRPRSRREASSPTEAGERDEHGVVAPPVPGKTDAASADAAAPVALPATPPGASHTSVEKPSDDVAAVGEASSMPGEHRGGFQRALTAPVPITESVHVPVEWAPAPPRPLPRIAPWALGLAIVGLCLSLIVGWAFPLGIAAFVMAIVALRRPWESRSVAVWALMLGLLSLVYSAGWLWWAAYQAHLLP